MTQTYIGILFSLEDVNVWNFEFRSLLFVCYLGFVICYFHVSIRNPQSEINSPLPPQEWPLAGFYKDCESR